jgi:hypothetical protein
MLRRDGYRVDLSLHSIVCSKRRVQSLAGLGLPAIVLRPGCHHCFTQTTPSCLSLVQCAFPVARKSVG